jgi:hypothetical protein
MSVSDLRYNLPPRDSIPATGKISYGWSLLSKFFPEGPPSEHTPFWEKKRGLSKEEEEATIYALIRDSKDLYDRYDKLVSYSTKLEETLELLLDWFSKNEYKLENIIDKFDAADNLKT